MPSEAQKKANYKYQTTQKYKDYKRQYMRDYYHRKKLEQLKNAFDKKS